MRAQARGLARACAAEVSELIFTAGPAGRLLPRRWQAAPLERLASPAGAAPPRPYPDLLITCGRRSVAVSAAMAAARPETVRVHIQDPRRPPADFDLVIALAHDDIAAAPNVLTTLTALHEVSADALAEAAAAWRDRLAFLPRPLTGIAIGGPTRRSGFSRPDARRLVGFLRAARRRGGLAITPSRRTPAAVRAILAREFAADPGVLLWDFQGDNPYLGILALSDTLIVSGDSVSMVSEAIATGAPVQVFDTGEGRHQRFLEGLVGAALVSRLPDPAPAGRESYEETSAAAAAVRRLVQARRTGRSG